MKKNINKDKYPIVWSKNGIEIKIYCSIPNVATGILITAGEHHFITDPGDGMLRDLNKDLTVGQILNISSIFITHGHHDHVGGVWSLLTYLKVMRKTSPVTIYCPAGCVEIETILSAFKKVYDKSIPYQVTLKKIRNSDKFRMAGVQVTPFEVIHKEKLISSAETRQVPALGYKFSYKGVKICYSGDTAYSAGLAAMAKGADVAILEAGNDENIDDGIHMTESQAAEIGKSAKEYFLVHAPGEK